MLQVGNKIRKIRELKNITPKDMADRLDMSLPGYAKIERDEVSINIERLVQIAEVLEMKPEEVMTFDEKYVFNNSGPNCGVGVNNTVTINFPEEMKRLYDENAKLQEEKNRLLADKIEYLMEKIKFLEEKGK